MARASLPGQPAARELPRRDHGLLRRRVHDEDLGQPADLRPEVHRLPAPGIHQSLHRHQRGDAEDHARGSGGTSAACCVRTSVSPSMIDSWRVTPTAPPQRGSTDVLGGAVAHEAVHDPDDPRACAATLLSWVTRITVCPWRVQLVEDRQHLLRRSWCPGSPWARRPGRSPARSPAPARSPRAGADRPRAAPGGAAPRSARPTRLQGLGRPLAPLGPPEPGVEHRKLHVAQRSWRAAAG